MNQPETNQFKDLSRSEISRLLKENTARILLNVQAVMKEKGIIQSELSFRIDSHKSHVSRMFKNNYHKNGLTTNVLGRIAVALEVKLADLVK